jgi:hypothetical protein
MLEKANRIFDCSPISAATLVTSARTVSSSKPAKLLVLVLGIGELRNKAGEPSDECWQG